MKFLRRGKQERLYKQWTEHAELPREAIPPPETRTPEAPADMKIGMDMKMWAEEENLSYRFRVKILNLVKRILGLE